VAVRVIVGLEADADWRAVAECLRSQGATDVRPPRASDPDVLRATFPSGIDPKQAASRAEALPGVSYAELDTIQQAFMEGDVDSAGSATPSTAPAGEQGAGSEGGIVQSQES
jgi:hypothetical protein